AGRGVGRGGAAGARAGPRPGRGADLAGVLADGHGRAVPGGRGRKPGAQPHRGRDGEVARAPPPQGTIRRTHSVATSPAAAPHIFFVLRAHIPFLEPLHPAVRSLLSKGNNPMASAHWFGKL